MTRSGRGKIVAATALVTILAGSTLSAQNKYDLKVPGGLAFSEFKGYESWPLVSVSEDGGLFAAILANPAMISAYQAGMPANGKPFPDGVKMAKIHWTMVWHGAACLIGRSGATIAVTISRPSVKNMYRHLLVPLL